MANDKHITGAVGIGRVYSVLGIKALRADIGRACSNADGKVNKWAKYKPTLVKDRMEDLQSEENDTLRENLWALGSGYPAEYSGRVRYGLVCRPASNMPYNMHECDYAYIAPKPSDHSFRLTDFSGYNHEAHLDVVCGATPNTSEIDPTIASLNVYVMPTSPAADSLTLNDLLGASVEGGYKSRYVCALVSGKLDADGNSNVQYCKALYWASDDVLPNSAPTQKPIASGGEEESSFTLPLTANYDGDGAPAAVTESGQHRVTFFLAPAGGFLNNCKAWRRIYLGGVAQNLVALPDVVGIVYDFQGRADLFTLSFAGVYLVRDDGAPQYSVSGRIYPRFKDPDSDNPDFGFDPDDEITFYLSLSAKGTSIASGTYTMAAQEISGKQWLFLKTLDAAPTDVQPGPVAVGGHLTYNGFDYPVNG